MKNSSASSRLPLLLALLAWVPAAHAGPLAEGAACLERSDLACAERIAAGAGEGAEALHLRARVAFHRGEFDRAVELLEGVRRASPGARIDDDLALYTATRDAARGMLTRRQGDVEVRYQPGVDLVLVDEAIEALQAAHDRIGPLLGGAPPGPIRMELYPTGTRFTAASGLPAEAVQNTGVVALSKWTRLLVTSPRALGRGYAWKDTVAHEYIHLVVAWRTRDRCPVWLQEGIARSHESMWRSPEPAPLQPLAQSLLADALSSDTLVPLERMHPSMAFLDSAEQAALAFAQVSTMVMQLRAVAGPDAVSRVLDRVRDGTDALQAVADVATGGSKDTFMRDWKGYLRSLDLVSRKLSAAPTVLNGAADDFGVDPVLSRRKDLAGHARLGDLLHEAGRDDAALIEYAKAVPSDEPPSPALVARVSRALVSLGRTDEAITRLRASVAEYPEFALTRKSLAELLLARGQNRAALAEFRAAADINPFDPAVQSALADLYASLGDRALADRHARYRRVLELGGEDPASTGESSR
jgi:tetratricopeptide (TPR) repeat protein